MTGKQLKNSILQWAIQGKLVPQDPNDEPASVLLEKIRAEKARLVKEGKIKRDKKESIIYRGEDNSYYEKFADGKVVCIDDEIPFEIPDNWCFARLGCVCDYLHRGKSPKYGVEQVLPIIAQKCNQWDKIYTDRCLFSNLSFIDKYTEEQYLQKGDIIINSTGGGTVGRTGIIEDYIFEKYPKFVADSHVTVVRGNILLTPRYIYYYLISPNIQTGIEERCSGSTNQIELGTSTVYNYLIPVPPYKEQLRINELMQVILQKVEKYGREQEKLENLSKLLPIHLKKSILQEAIQGRLVPQEPNDEPASELLQRIKEEKKRLVKEGKLKKKDVIDSTIFRGDDNKYFEKKGKETVCIDEEIPFEIPDTWAWVRLSDVVQVNPKNDVQDNTLAAFIPMERIDATYLSSFTYSERKWGDIKSGFTHFADGDVAFAKITPCFQNRKSMILKGLPNGVGAGTTELKVLRPYAETIDREYLLFFLESSYFVEEATFKGTANQQRIISGYMENKLFPLPPLSEQRRIAEKIKESYKRIGL